MENRLPLRNEIPEEMTWKLSDIYETTELWEEDYKKAIERADELAGMAGSLTESAETLLKAMDIYEDAVMKVYRLYGYAEMLHDQDTSEPENQKLFQRAQSLDVKINEKLSFLEPEILEADPKVIEAYYKELPELLKYKNVISEIQRTREHTLSKEMEELLASAGDMAEAASNARSMLANADIRFPNTKGEDGKDIQLSNGRFVPLQMSTDREVRKESFEKFYEEYKNLANTWAALYDGQVKKQIFYAKARKYPDTFTAAVDKNNVSTTVCDNLISCVNRNLDKFYRYVRLRKKLLKVDELHMYDVYTPMVGNYEYKVSFEEAKEISLRALRSLGDDYIELLKTAYDNRWIDVVENKGKRGGAYSSGVYGVHPYVLLNFNNTLDDIFTLVHEMGHSIHTYYSNEKQNFFDSNYKIFVAEVASTTNEVLLLKYLLGKAESDKEKAYLINHFLESFKGTLYRQTMFAEFERESNKLSEEGTPLTAETLSELYLSLNKKYFGEDMVSDPLIAYEWCRIPHFYYNFYVYQYATGISAAIALYKRVINGGQKELDDYLGFLKSGNSKYAIDTLRDAGVDMTTPKPIEDLIAYFDELQEQLRG